MPGTRKESATPKLLVCCGCENLNLVEVSLYSGRTKLCSTMVAQEDLLDYFHFNGRPLVINISSCVYAIRAHFPFFKSFLSQTVSSYSSSVFVKFYTLRCGDELL